MNFWTFMATLVDSKMAASWLQVSGRVWCDLVTPPSPDILGMTRDEIVNQFATTSYEVRRRFRRASFRLRKRRRRRDVHVSHATQSAVVGRSIYTRTRISEKSGGLCRVHVMSIAVM